MNKGRKKRIAAAAVVLALAGGTATYFLTRKSEQTQQGPTVQVERGDLRETAAATGKIEPHVQVEVKSRTSGEVVEILVKEGDTVTQGQVLVRLDPLDAERDLASAKVSLEKAKADLTAAQASVTVAQIEHTNKQGDEALAKKSADLGLGNADAVRTTGSTTKVAAANINLKNAQVIAAKTNLKTAEIAVQDAETRLKETTIYAPIAGTVLDIPVEKGTIVSSALTNMSGGTSVLTIADLSDLRVIGAIDEAQIGKVSPGQVVEIRVDAYPDRVFEGKVERVSPLGKEVSSIVTFDVEIIVVDKNKGLLRSGMSADVEIVTSELKDVLLIPLLSIETSGRSRFVRLPNGEQRPIKTGTTDGSRMVVLEGVDEGDSIMASAPASSARSGGTARPQSGMGVMGGPPGGGRR